MAILTLRFSLVYDPFHAEDDPISFRPALCIELVIAAGIEILSRVWKWKAEGQPIAKQCYSSFCVFLD
jgi:hypothetical protein